MRREEREGQHTLLLACLLDDHNLLLDGLKGRMGVEQVSNKRKI